MIISQRLSHLLRVVFVMLLVLMGLVLLTFIHQPAAPLKVHAEPLPGGTPKLTLSTKTVTPTLTTSGDITLTYVLHLINTGAWTATSTSLIDVLPTVTTYLSGSVLASSGSAVIHSNVLSWTGSIGFDSSVAITFNAKLTNTFSLGRVVNTAVVSDVMLAAPISLTAVTTVTNAPIFLISKSSAPQLPGPNKPLYYTITVANNGQAAFNLPITVTDRVPFSTSLRDIGMGGFTSPISDVVTWTRSISIGLGETTAFTFSVNVGNVPSGTVIANTNYQITSPVSGAIGSIYTTTVINPIFILYKNTWPDPPGSNREMTYTLSLLNIGSLATNLVITDRVPAGVGYVRGGTQSAGIVSWTLPSLDSNQLAQFTYTVYISNVANVSIINQDYAACSTEICHPGSILTSVVQGPNFATAVYMDPIAKKPGGGTGTYVTPTLVVQNLGPGNALNVVARLFFDNISVSGSNLYVTPSIGTLVPAATCGTTSCFVWTGALNYGQTITFTLHNGTNSIGGSEGNPYSATVVITALLSNLTTTPVTGTAGGVVTHYASPVPSKSAPDVIGRGELLTYTIKVLNGGFTTQYPPILTDTIPLSTTFVGADNGGVSRTIGISTSTPTTIVSWTLPSLGPGASATRSFWVLVNNDLISGTNIVNNNYVVTGYGNVVTGAVTYGPPVTTTVKEVGLIDSFKEVTPTLSYPEAHKVLTYYLHIVNSGPLSLTNVTADDILPWQNTTYQRDARVTAGQLVSDIVALHWAGDVGPFSSQVVTFSVLVDPDFKGVITNTASISHPALIAPVVVQAIAYVTDRPVLSIMKSATPDPVASGGILTYTLTVLNQGQSASGLIITDVVPANTTYITNSATFNGQFINGQVQWSVPALAFDQNQVIAYQVKVNGGLEVVNDRYAVTSLEGAVGFGEPVVTTVSGSRIYLPLVLRNH